jgi:DnaA N-terminal domain
MAQKSGQMLSKKPVGRYAAALKYDLITALGAHALSLGKADQRRILRLITLITARYNWARDELAVGQREIARLWSCDERTVKREMARLRGLGWLVVHRQGTRGRVTEYGLDSARILLDTKANWAAIGPDFVLRLEGQGAESTQSSVVPFPGPVNVAPPDLSSNSEWALAQAVLYSEDSANFDSWLRGLARADRAGGRLTLRAPSRFHASYVQTHLAGRILAACQAVDDDISSLCVVW